MKNYTIPRILFLGLAILLQIALIVGMVIKFYQYFTYFYAVNIFISSLVVLWIVNDESNPAYKIAWIIPIMLFPIFGGLFYILIGKSSLSKKIVSKMHKIEEKTKEVLIDNQEKNAMLRSQDMDAAKISHYISNYAYYPLYYSNNTEYYRLGEEKFKRLKEELNKAERFIFMEYFIIEEGIMWNSILDILKEKASKGVDVRIIYDDIGCLGKLTKEYNKKLENMGIRCHVFNPVRPILSLAFNNRDHRKITVIDGKVGFTGGINLADEYINEIELHGHWKDTAILFDGEAVWSLTVMFLSLWEYLDSSNEDYEKYRYKNGMDEYKGGFIQPFSDNPLDKESVGETVYLNIINNAKDYVYITTPYLIIDNEMLTALCIAAKNGVDVRIITPHHGDKWYVHAVTRSYYKPLVNSGVKIYEYTPGFIHSKTYVSDDKFGVVGTINMDYRSLYLHFECGVWMYNTASISDLKADFVSTLEKCTEIEKSYLDNNKWYKTIGRSVLRLFAPLM